MAHVRAKKWGGHGRPCRPYAASLVRRSFPPYVCRYSRAFLSLGVTWVFLAIFSVHDIEDDTCTLNSFHKDFSVTFWWLNLTSLVASLAIQQYLWFITVLIYKGFLPFCFKVTYIATPVSCF